MRPFLLPAAAALALLIGVAHSYLGERYILIRLLRLDLPRLFGSDWFTKRTLRFAWHVTTIAWWGFAALLLTLPATGEVASRLAVLWVVVGVFGVSGGVALVASRGRHLSWIVFLAIALLAAAAACASTAETVQLQLTALMAA